MPLTSQIIQDIVKKVIIDVIKEFQDENRQEFKKLNAKIDKSQEHVDWFMSKYSKLDEDHETVSSQVANHSDRLDKLETKVFGAPQV